MSFCLTTIKKGCKRIIVGFCATKWLPPQMQEENATLNPDSYLSHFR